MIKLYCIGSIKKNQKEKNDKEKEKEKKKKKKCVRLYDNKSDTFMGISSICVL